MAVTSIGVYGVIIAGWASIPSMRSLVPACLVPDGSVLAAMGFCCRCTEGPVPEFEHHRQLCKPRLVAHDHGRRSCHGTGFCCLPLFGVYRGVWISAWSERPASIRCVEGESEIAPATWSSTRGWLRDVLLGEYANMILLATMATRMFMGGCSAPLDLAKWGIELPAGGGGGEGGVGGVWRDRSVALVSGCPIKMFVGYRCLVWFRASVSAPLRSNHRLGWKCSIPDHACLACGGRGLMADSVESVAGGVRGRKHGLSASKGAL